MQQARDQKTILSGCWTVYPPLPKRTLIRYGNLAAAFMGNNFGEAVQSILKTARRGEQPVFHGPETGLITILFNPY